MGGETLLAQILRASGRSQAWVARQMDVDPSSVSRWVGGDRRIPAHHVRQLASVVGIDEKLLEADNKESR